MNRYKSSRNRNGKHGKAIATFDVDYVLKKLDNLHKTATFKGYVVKANSTPGGFKRKALLRSMKCTCCGKEGNIFRLEKMVDGGVGLHLYHRGHTGGKVYFSLLTVDHIIPKNLGGGNGQYNLQTMCSKCNHRKSNALQLEYSNYKLFWNLFKNNKRTFVRVLKICTNQKIRRCNKWLTGLRTGLKSSLFGF